MFTDTAVYVRNSRSRARATVEFTHEEWRAFIASVQEGDDYTLPS
jgi:hypothetical protein